MSLQSSHETLFLSIINTNRDALHVYSHQQLLLDLPSPHYIPASSLPLPSSLLSSSSPPSNPSAHFSPSYQTAETRCLVISSDGFQFRYQFKNLTSNIQGLRLRWLNYLTPDIRRGEFKEDEVDLIIKLHKLLGNRWSLIAGRLPGRTANDVKNYWNFHLSKRLSMQKGEQSQIKSMKPTTTTTAKIIRPKPRTFSPNSLWLNGVGSSIVEAQLQKMSYNTMLASPGEESTLWWKSLLADGEEEDDTWWSKSGEVGLEVELPQIFGVGEMEMMNKKEEEGLGEWKNMLLDLDQWGLWET